MDRNEIKEIVRDVVLKYLSSKGMIEKERIFVLLHTRSSQPAKVWELVRNLSHQYQLTICISEQWLTIPEDLQAEHTVLLNEENITYLQRNIQKHTMLIVPTLNYGTLSKLEQMFDDDLSVWFMLQMQIAGKPVIVANDEIKLTTMQMLHISDHLKERIKKKITRLKSTGVHLTSLEKLSEKLKKVQKNLNEKAVLVLEKHIQSLVAEGKSEIKLPKKHVITPMAKDLIRKHHIQIVILE